MMNLADKRPDKVYVAAHRGWYNKYPENTMPAFRAAVELGVDQVETDVRISADGELVLIHDATLERTTNGTGKVIDKTLEYYITHLLIQCTSSNTYSIVHLPLAPQGSTRPVSFTGSPISLASTFPPNLVTTAV